MAKMAVVRLNAKAVAGIIARVRCKDEQLELACLGNDDGDA